VCCTVRRAAGASTSVSCSAGVLTLLDLVVTIEPAPEQQP
jgi:hypothetical protein